MITGFILSTSLIFSIMLKGADAYQGMDMTDEEFSDFVDAHYDMFDTVTTFVSENRGHFETGGIGGLTGLALKGAFTSTHPVINSFVAGGAIELAKNFYKNTVHGKVAKEERVAELERQLEAVIKEINELKASGNFGTNHQIATLGDFSCGHAHNPSGGRNDIRSSVYSIGSHTFTTESKEAGPHRSEYRVYRDPSTREIRDTIDTIVHEALNPRDNHVTRSDKN